MEPNYTAWWLDATDEAEDWRERAERAEAELAAIKTPCVWTVDGQGWFVCGCDGDLRRKTGEFCPGCGHAVQVVEVQP